ncbi:MAG: GNAT family N-acetyltransferase [Solidesulfovibrio sp. DCME]|uniref:GNAT family N-acetyltransferase n=1 Tax=Solidesulfovibrio sp. DCME TaxID=3447380 RepID=UPI003D10463B
MAQQVRVHPLDPSHRPELMHVLVPAFARHPVFAPGTPQATVAALLDLLLDMFCPPDRALLYGIRQEGELACVALALDPRDEPGGLKLLLFFSRFLRIMGWRSMMEFFRIYLGRPHYQARYLELFLLGTLPAWQRSGLGREMLGFLYDLAAARGFAGLILTAARESPACGFYSREGFVIDSEAFYRGVAMVNMRRDGPRFSPLP